MNSFVNPLPGVPDVESPFFEEIFASKAVTPDTIDVARRLRRDGFAVIDIPDPDLDRHAAEIISALDQQYDWNGWRNGTVPNLRVQDAWKNISAVRALATNAAILKLLSELYGRRAFPFQTLNFPVGTQQHFHSDSIHFSSCPERFMAGVWVALEDIDADNGPLIYYPGSHSLPVFTNEHVAVDLSAVRPDSAEHYRDYAKAWEAIVDALHLKPMYFHAKKGQALIWAANLLHGGAPQNDMRRTRYSQVTHYFFDNCAYYTPLLSVPFLGSIYLRDIVDIATGQRVPNNVNGTAVSQPRTADTPVQGLRKPPKLPKDFDRTAYLRANPDVAAAKMDAAKHWIEFGYSEGRALR